MMQIELIEEPKIEFADEYLCEDPKMGITNTGFYSQSHNSHHSEIHYAIIGTKKNIENMKDWMKQIENKIEAEAIPKNVTVPEPNIDEDGEVRFLFEDDEESEEEDKSSFVQNKKLNPDFHGFNKKSVFKSEFLNDELNNISFRDKKIKEIIRSEDPRLKKAEKLIEVFKDAYISLCENCTTKPDICFVIINSEIYKKLGSIKDGKQYFNFRRKLKAEIISSKAGDIPTQFVIEDTIKGTKANMQEMSMIAWNFVVAQYYKTSNCIPWALTDVDKNTCFVGISFHKILNRKNNLLRSSIAQAFNREGKGLVFLGKQFEWNKSETKVSSPHLQYNYAKDLIINVLNNYIKVNNHTPSRLVIHKTTDFWNKGINENYPEQEGFRDGIEERLGEDTEIDLVTLKTPKIKLLRNDGKYPVIRGTLLKINETKGVLYTTGYVPYLETFPGVHIPSGLQLDIIGDSTLREISKEILALTKLNFNNCNFYDSLPITLRFSKKVGEIVQYLDEGAMPPTKYYYYM